MKTIAIGISALNEEQAIGQLLRSLCNQILDNASITSIIVVSDGSSDQTVIKAKEVVDARIIVQNYSQRLGKAKRLNAIIKEINEDILVMLDADIMIKDSRCIQKLIEPIIAQRAEFTSANLDSLPARTYLEQVLSFGFVLKSYLKKSWNNGDNYLSCHGPVRAFSKKYYINFEIKQSVAEDAYSYIWGKVNKMSYEFVKDAKVYIRQPSIIQDHYKQSLRYQQNSEVLETYFNKQLVRYYTHIPLHTVAVCALKATRLIVTRPGVALSYLAIVIYSRVKNLALKTNMSESWDAVSSKTI